MVYERVKTYYISGTGSDSRLIRYDVIFIDKDTYKVKIFDDQQRGISPPHSMVMLSEFDFTRAEYEQRHGVGKNNMVRIDMAPSFEGDLLERCQEHRNSI